MDSKIIEQIVWAIIVSVGFAIFFKTPKRALWAAALLGGIGFSCKT